MMSVIDIFDCESLAGSINSTRYQHATTADLYASLLVSMITHRNFVRLSAR